MKKLLYVFAFACVLVTAALAGDFVTNPAATLPGPKSDVSPLPQAADPDKYLRAADYNALTTATYDLREPLLNAPIVTTTSWPSLGNEKVVSTCTSSQTLTFNGTTFSCLSVPLLSAFPTCAAGQYLTYNGSTFSCANGSATGAGTTLSYVTTAYEPTLDNEKVVATCSAGQMLTYNGTSFSCVDVVLKTALPTCTSGQFLYYNGTTVSCVTETTHAPVSAAYVTTASDGTLTSEKVIPTCTTGQYLTYQNGAFSCQDDSQNNISPAASFVTTASEPTLDNEKVVATCTPGQMLTYSGGSFSCVAVVLASAIPTCGTGQYLTYSSNTFTCVTPPTGASTSLSYVTAVSEPTLANEKVLANCGANQVLTYQNGAFACITIIPGTSVPTCSVATQYLTYDGSTFSCVAAAPTNAPYVTTTSVGGLSNEKVVAQCTTGYLVYNGTDFVCAGTDVEARLISIEAAICALGGGGYPCQPPTITSCTPSSGAVGSQVVCTGSGFASTRSVTFYNNQAAAFQINSDGQVTTTVPAGAQNGNISITTGTAPAATWGPFTVTSGVPGAPTNLATGTITSSSIALSWTAASGSPTGYYVERAPDSGSNTAGTWTQYADVANTSYTAGSLAGNTKYWFRVRAYNASGTGAYSSSVSGTTSADAFPLTVATVTKYTQPVVSEPALGASITNQWDGVSANTLSSAYNTKTTRVKDLRHQYAKAQVWNCDETLAMTCNTASGQCSGYGTIIDGTTYATKYQLSGVPDDFKVWGNKCPDDAMKIWGVRRTDLKWQRLDVGASSNTVTTLKTYTNTDWSMATLTAITLGSGEGNIDDNDQYASLGLALSGTAYTRVGVINVADGSVRCRIMPETKVYVSPEDPGDGCDGTRVANDSTISHDGSYVLVPWSNYDKLDVYSTTPDANGYCPFVRTIVKGTGHYEPCVSTAGRQVVVSEPSPTGTSPMQMFDLETGAATTIYVDNAIGRWHLSCRSKQRPGWVTVGHDMIACDADLFKSQTVHNILNIKLDGSGLVERWAWDHAPCKVLGETAASYEQSPMPVPSPSGTRIWWKTAWDTNPGNNNTIRSFVATKN